MHVQPLESTSKRATDETATVSVSNVMLNALLGELSNINNIYQLHEPIT